MAPAIFIYLLLLLLFLLKSFITVCIIINNFNDLTYKNWNSLPKQKISGPPLIEAVTNIYRYETQKLPSISGLAQNNGCCTWIGWYSSPYKS